MNTLPDKTDTGLQIAISHLLSQYSSDEVSLIMHVHMTENRKEWPRTIVG